MRLYRSPGGHVGVPRQHSPRLGREKEEENEKEEKRMRAEGGKEPPVKLSFPRNYRVPSPRALHIPPPDAFLSRPRDISNRGRAKSEPSCNIANLCNTTCKISSSVFRFDDFAFSIKIKQICRNWVKSTLPIIEKTTDVKDRDFNWIKEFMKLVCTHNISSLQTCSCNVQEKNYRLCPARTRVEK